MKRPEFEHLTPARHVYYEDADHGRCAAIVAHVGLDIEGDPSGFVNLFVISPEGTSFARLSVPYNPTEPFELGSWRWMFPEQARVSTAGSKPTPLEPPSAGA